MIVITVTEEDGFNMFNRKPLATAETKRDAKNYLIREGWQWSKGRQAFYKREDGDLLIAAFVPVPKARPSKYTKEH